jgi:4-hydroxybenzoate polyprenyltransferase
VFANDASTLGAFLRSLRMWQWLKNLLVLAPLFAAHRWGDTGAVIDALTVFLSFCLTASATYHFNDIVDLDADRSHPNKRRRPMAAGDIPITLGVGAAMLLLVSGLLLAWQVSMAVLSLMLLYLLVTGAYSFFLKSRAVIDLVVLAGLYTLRIVAGALALGVMPSFWLLAFSMFLFLSLSALKRCAELRSASLPPGAFLPGRGYEGSDLPFLTGFGASLGSGAVVILALFINSAETARQYALPELLWLLCPLLVYWIGRMWIKTGRGEMHDDPIVFASKDKVSVVLALLGLVVVFAAV